MMDRVAIVVVAALAAAGFAVLAEPDAAQLPPVPPGARAERLPVGEAALPPMCGLRDSIVVTLGGKYGEGPVGFGLGHDGVVVELFVADDGGWTIIETLPDGRACFAAWGEAWMPVTPKPKGDPS